MQLLSDVYQLLEANKNSMEFLKTGFSTLDEKLDGGLLRKELTVIGGATGIGKSYLAAQFMANIAKQGFKTAYFSLEISSEMVVSRLIGAIANIKATRVRTGLLTLVELEQIETAKSRLKAYEQYFSFYDNTYELHEIIKEIKNQKYEFIVIDFIQNVIADGKDEYSRLSKAAIDLQRAAKETNSCILVLSQLSNATARENIESRVLEYRGSGAIAMVADLGFFIDRDQSLLNPEIDKVSLVLKKNRRGISHVFFPLVFRHPGGWIYEESAA